MLKKLEKNVSNDSHFPKISKKNFWKPFPTNFTKLCQKKLSAASKRREKRRRARKRHETAEFVKQEARKCWKRRRRRSGRPQWAIHVDSRSQEEIQAYRLTDF